MFEFRIGICISLSLPGAGTVPQMLHDILKASKTLSKRYKDHREWHTLCVEEVE